MKARRRRWRPALEHRFRPAVREAHGALVARVGPEVTAAAIHGVVSERPSETLAAVERGGVRVLLLAVSDTVREVYGHAALERFRDRLPSAAVEIVDSGHDVLADAPEETIGLVGRWVRASR